uniref:CSON000972 protein n=1 Tax=Culicoides sonorensis TaxID=179676 RepID=A0A336K616_CULSO
MSLIEFELKEVRKLCENVIEQSTLISCEESIIRVDIAQTASRRLTICLRFPKEDYPSQSLLIELKSKTLNDKILENLTKTLEDHCKGNLLGKPQILPLLKFLSKTLNENPLCICYDEVVALKQLCVGTQSEIKLKQKKTSVGLNARAEKYYFKLDAFIPSDYPHSRPEWTSFESNFPDMLTRYLNGQAKEIVRRCIEPPLRQVKDAPPFTVRPSLEKAFSFIIKATHEFHSELCHVCKKKCLPKNPEDIVTDENDDLYVERVFCGHIYHSGCLKKYFSEPPFPEGGKVCLADKKHARPDGLGSNMSKLKGNNSTQKKEIKGCGQRLMHDKWALDPKKAEQRWAHKKARARELEEVEDFFK